MLQGDYSVPNVQGDLWTHCLNSFVGHQWISFDVRQMKFIAAGVLMREEAAREARADSLATGSAFV